jgi:hypothetical protein
VAPTGATPDVRYDRLVHALNRKRRFRRHPCRREVRLARAPEGAHERPLRESVLSPGARTAVPKTMSSSVCARRSNRRLAMDAAVAVAVEAHPYHSCVPRSEYPSLCARPRPPRTYGDAIKEHATPHATILHSSRKRSTMSSPLRGPSSRHNPPAPQPSQEKRAARELEVRGSARGEDESLFIGEIKEVFVRSSRGR